MDHGDPTEYSSIADGKSKKNKRREKLDQKESRLDSATNRSEKNEPRDRKDKKKKAGKSEKRDKRGNNSKVETQRGKVFSQQNGSNSSQRVSNPLKGFGAANPGQRMPGFMGMTGGMMGTVPLQMSLKLQMATLQALANMNSQMGQKGAGGGNPINLLKNMPSLLGQKRPSAAFQKPAPSLNLLANLQKQKKDWDKQKSQQGLENSDAASDSKIEKQDLAAQLEELDQRANKRLKISKDEV